jgi:hypothetical protein
MKEVFDFADVTGRLCPYINLSTSPTEGTIDSYCGVNMRIEDRDDYIDLVAQAVIDRIEENDRVNGLVNMVVARVFELQKQKADEAKANAEQSGEAEASETSPE